MCCLSSRASSRPGGEGGCVGAVHEGGAVARAAVWAPSRKAAKAAASTSSSRRGGEGVCVGAVQRGDGAGGRREARWRCKRRDLGEVIVACNRFPFFRLI
jgi:hypothetical protein